MERTTKGEKRTIFHFCLRVHMHIFFFFFSHTHLELWWLHGNGTDWMDGIYIHMTLHERGAHIFFYQNYLCFQGAFNGMDKDGIGVLGPGKGGRNSFLSRGSFFVRSFYFSFYRRWEGKH